MSKGHLRKNKKAGLRSASVRVLFMALLAGPPWANAADGSCDAIQVAQLRSQMLSWSLADSSTIDNTQRLIDLSGNCSGASGDPQKASFAFIVALASEVKARALREQKSYFTSAAQTATIMFQFVANDKQANQKDRRDANMHLTEMSDLLAQSAKQR